MRGKKIKSSVLFCVAFLLLFSQVFAGQYEARKAAISDCHNKLTELIHEIHIDSPTQVKDLIAADDTIKTSLDEFIRDAEIMSEDYGDGIFTVTMRINVEKLQELIGKDLEYEDPYIEVTGQGVDPTNVEPPSKEDPPSEQESDTPWYEQTIKAKGYGAISDDPSVSQAQKIPGAKRAAKMDALRNLIEQIKGVYVDSKTTIKDFVTQSDTIESNIQAFVQGARIIETKDLGDGSFEVSVEINLRPLKAIVK